MEKKYHIGKRMPYTQTETNTEAYPGTVLYRYGKIVPVACGSIFRAMDQLDS